MHRPRTTVAAATLVLLSFRIAMERVHPDLLKRYRVAPECAPIVPTQEPCHVFSEVA